VRRAFFLLATLAALGCEREPTAPTKAAPAPSSEPQARAPKPLTFVEDDMARAVAQALKERKALFVDVWAPWCHTCLSMKSFVLSDPAMGPLDELAVFASIDYDKPENAAFLEKHGVHGLPSFLVIDPENDRVVGNWIGSGSVREMKAMIEASASAVPALAAAHTSSPASAAFAEGAAARAAGKPNESAAAFERAVKAAPADWPLRSEALLAWAAALQESDDGAGCAKVAGEHLNEVTGSSLPSDLSITLLNCSEKLEPAERAKARAAAIAKLTAYVTKPPSDAAIDDRGDAYSNLAQAVEETDKDAAKKLREQWAAMLEQAAKSAPSVEAAHTFDYQRANAYMALGRFDDAIKMLTEREKQLPDSYEPPARLARVNLKAGKLDDADAAAKRAIAKAYGPRRMLYVGLRADIAKARGDIAQEIAVLKDLVRGYRELPQGQAAPKMLADAEKRLEGAEARARGDKH
jgi:tetratricopeptide (TPR) repeat protein